MARWIKIPRVRKCGREHLLANADRVNIIAFDRSRCLMFTVTSFAAAHLSYSIGRPHPAIHNFGWPITQPRHPVANGGLEYLPISLLKSLNEVSIFVISAVLRFQILIVSKKRGSISEFIFYYKSGDFRSFLLWHPRFGVFWDLSMIRFCALQEPNIPIQE